MGETLVRMPKLADTLVEGTLGQWLKQVGETVGQGEPLASIETDKITTEMPSPAAGTLLEHLVPEGQTVPVETVIARIGAAISKRPQADPGGGPPACRTRPHARAGHDPAGTPLQRRGLQYLEAKGRLSLPRSSPFLRGLDLPAPSEAEGRGEVGHRNAPLAAPTRL